MNHVCVCFRKWVVVSLGRGLDSPGTGWIEPTPLCLRLFTSEYDSGAFVAPARFQPTSSPLSCYLSGISWEESTKGVPHGSSVWSDREPVIVHACSPARVLVFRHTQTLSGVVSSTCSSTCELEHLVTVVAIFSSITVSATYLPIYKRFDLSNFKTGAKRWRLRTPPAVPRCTRQKAKSEERDFCTEEYQHREAAVGVSGVHGCVLINRRPLDGRCQNPSVVLHTGAV